MKIHQIRNATLVVEIGEHKLLVDTLAWATSGESLSFEAVPGGRADHPVGISREPAAGPGFRKWLVDPVAKVM